MNQTQKITIRAHTSNARMPIAGWMSALTTTTRYTQMIPIVNDHAKLHQIRQERSCKNDPPDSSA
ncbi:hypothetical protein ABN070_17635, partial [Morganella morganii]